MVPVFLLVLLLHFQLSAFLVHLFSRAHSPYSCPWSQGPLLLLYLALALLVRVGQGFSIMLAKSPVFTSVPGLKSLSHPASPPLGNQPLLVCLAQHLVWGSVSCSSQVVGDL